ncbi:unnamed protein product [Didymodactylos carnosus]|uniref:Uncharacterized protein n=1 Tax=Didymodactylos carnosus TaxID=1234261 RepID=A0A815H2C8_9BILA|nr:unnamed protein product [Didymodactylos carnosus]CAF1348308.1 unnamed protein product [Didymodactylos carnosus]CAF3817155.1 unnamed protein product [Didymodactylos carnosus]CAF4216012.1 unnamed protein product [Didymodactylos carnosus]
MAVRLSCLDVPPAIVYATINRAAGAWCYLSGDPHIIPFATLKQPNPGQLNCYQHGCLVLLKNKWVIVTIFVSPAYTTHYFEFMFLDGSGGTGPLNAKCVVDSTCLQNSPSSCCPAGNYYYDLNLWQPDNLVSSSTGVCVKGGCTGKPLTFLPVPIKFDATKVCNIMVLPVRLFIYDENYLKLSINGDITDVIFVNDFCVQWPIFQAIAQLKPDVKQLQGYVAQAVQAINGAFATANRQVSQIGPSTTNVTISRIS